MGGGGAIGSTLISAPQRKIFLLINFFDRVEIYCLLSLPPNYNLSHSTLKSQRGRTPFYGTVEIFPSSHPGSSHFIWSERVLGRVASCEPNFTASVAQGRGWVPLYVLLACYQWGSQHLHLLASRGPLYLTP